MNSLTLFQCCSTENILFLKVRIKYSNVFYETKRANRTNFRHVYECAILFTTLLKPFVENVWKILQLVLTLNVDFLEITLLILTYVYRYLFILKSIHQYSYICQLTEKTTPSISGSKPYKFILVILKLKFIHHILFYVWQYFKMKTIRIFQNYV